MPNYRKIYEEHFECCLLPIIDIHHRDGNRGNNEISNLMPVTLEEHYDIHKAQGEYFQAYLISLRMKQKPADWIEFARQGGLKASRMGKGFKAGHASRAGKIGGVTGGNYAVKNKTGIHNISEEANYRRELNSKTTKAINAGKASPIRG